MSARYETRKDSVHPYFGVWDHEQGEWHDGAEYDDAVYAAGCPFWKSSAGADAVTRALNESDHPRREV